MRAKKKNWLKESLFLGVFNFTEARKRGKQERFLKEVELSFCVGVRVCSWLIYPVFFTSKCCLNSDMLLRSCFPNYFTIIKCLVLILCELWSHLYCSWSLQGKCNMGSKDKIKKNKNMLYYVYLKYQYNVKILRYNINLKITWNNALIMAGHPQ